MKIFLKGLVILLTFISLAIPILPPLSIAIDLIFNIDIYEKIFKYIFEDKEKSCN